MPVLAEPASASAGSLTSPRDQSAQISRCQSFRRTYIFRAVRREPDGLLGPDLYRQAFEAQDDSDAVAVAKRIDLDMAGLGANAVYVSAEDGRAIWSLHAQALLDQALLDQALLDPDR